MTTEDIRTVCLTKVTYFSKYSYGLNKKAVWLLRLEDSVVSFSGSGPWAKLSGRRDKLLNLVFLKLPAPMSSSYYANVLFFGIKSTVPRDMYTFHYGWAFIFRFCHLESREDEEDCANRVFIGSKKGEKYKTWSSEVVAEHVLLSIGWLKTNYANLVTFFSPRNSCYCSECIFYNTVMKTHWLAPLLPGPCAFVANKADKKAISGAMSTDEGNANKRTVTRCVCAVVIWHWVGGADFTGLGFGERQESLHSPWNNPHNRNNFHPLLVCWSTNQSANVLRLGSLMKPYEMCWVDGSFFFPAKTIFKFFNMV